MKTVRFASRLEDRLLGDPATVALVALEERDLAELEHLLREAEVAEWWDELDMEEVRSFIGHDYVTPFRIVAAGRTVGYAQAYHANKDPFWVAFGVPRETFGLDLSIGEAAARGRGVGRAAVRLLIDRLLAWREVVRVQIDPEPDNERAVRSYRAAGFEARGVYPGYDGDEMLYMTIDRPLP